MSWARVLSKVGAYNPSTYLFGRAVDLVVPGDQSARSYETGLYRVLGGDGGVGGFNQDEGEPLGNGNYNPSWGDAWRSTADDFTPDYFYTAPAERGFQGTQAGHSPFVDDVKDALPKVGKGLLIAAAVVVAILASRPTK